MRRPCLAEAALSRWIPLLEACASARRVNDALQRLSTREREAAILTAQGLSAKEVATRMGCTVKTAKTGLTHRDEVHPC